MYILILIYPFLGSYSLDSLADTTVEVFCFFKHIVCFTIFFTSLFIFFEVGLCGAVTLISLFDWFVLDVFFISFVFYLTNLLLLCCYYNWNIFFCTFIFHSYMSHDPHISRFMAYLSLFTFFMIFLVTADNFVQMFIVERVWVYVLIYL